MMTSPSAMSVRGKHALALGRADSKTGKIVIVAADRGPAFPRSRRRSARSRPRGSRRDAGDHGRADLGLELAAGVVVEKKQRLCALHHQVVHAHRDQIDADGVVAAGFDGDLELGADAVGCGDQDRVAVSRPA